MTPIVGQKVKIIRDTETVYGTIAKIYPPNQGHSGRFIVWIHERNRSHVAEFWYSDYGVSVIPEDK